MVEKSPRLYGKKPGIKKEESKESEESSSEKSAKTDSRTTSKATSPSKKPRRRKKSSPRTSRPKENGNSRHTSESLKAIADTLLKSLPGEPNIVHRDQHPISRKKIDEDALKVLYRLNKNGYQAYIVGGGVRDLYLGKEPKDFDLATNATPTEVRSLFRNSRTIGRRFKLSHLYFRGGKIIELATFRSNEEDPEATSPDILSPDNIWGDPETDAFRRDITINGLFYDLESFSIIDYVDGIKDLERGLVRFIGVPKIRVQEDPVRMIRVLRHAARTGFSVAAETYDAICESPALLKHCPISRLYEELLKDLRSGVSRTVFPLYKDSGLLKYLLPSLQNFIDLSPQTWQRVLARLSMIDKLVLKFKDKNKGQEVPPSVLMLALFLGNIPEKSLEIEELSDKETLVLKTLLSNEPFSSQSPTDTEAADNLIEGNLLKVNEKVKESLREIIKTCLRSFGVSKKDGEYIEKILILRMKMFEVFAGSQRTKLNYLDAFSDTLTILDLTNQSSWSDENYEFWYSQKEKYIKKKKPNRRYR